MNVFIENNAGHRTDMQGVEFIEIESDHLHIKITANDRGEFFIEELHGQLVSVSSKQPFLDSDDTFTTQNPIKIS